jgi:hypothetical protein
MPVNGRRKRLITKHYWRLVAHGEPPGEATYMLAVFCASRVAGEGGEDG